MPGMALTGESISLCLNWLIISVIGSFSQQEIEYRNTPVIHNIQVPF